MISTFFIQRPIAALVVSILITLFGVVTYSTLPVDQYPEITPPVVRVSTTYPGASAEVITETVAAPIEQEVNGVDNMLYMSSNSASDGTYNLDVTFALGTDVDIASVLVQNRVNAAEPKLPEEVKRQGVTTRKQSTNIIAVVSFDSTDGSLDDTFLSNYLTLNIKDELLRINGVGSINVFPAKDYAMRIWLDPEKLKARELSTTDVVEAIREQNVQVAAGAIGRPPAPSDQDFQYTISTLGRLDSDEQFAEIILKRNEQGGLTRLKDVARIERGAKGYDNYSDLNGAPSATMLIYQTPGSNAVATAEEVRNALAELIRKNPVESLRYKVVYDISDFIIASINEVYETLIVAFVLVVLVVLVFLQDWRTTLIPSITIPVSLIGTFAAMAAFGFSLNMLTLFGLVLAIGVVVDDAIVVVESVQRMMAERPELSSRDAAIETMREVTGPIIATSLVLMAVFVPASLMAGLTGQLYRQFALTIAASTLFSTINALTLSPSLAALLLKRPDPNRPLGLLARIFGGLEKTIGLFFRPFTFLFNKSFDGLTSIYVGIVSLTVRRLILSVPLFLALLVLTYTGLIRIPGGFLPIEDQGLVLVDVKLPDASSQQRTHAVTDRISEILAETDGVEDIVIVGGYSLLSGGGSNNAVAFATLEPWDDRLPRGRNLRAIIGELRGKLYRIQEAQILTFTLPAIPGLGSTSGFDFRIQDASGQGVDSLQLAADDVVSSANAQSRLQSVGTTFRAGVPQLYADVDREKVKRLGIPLAEVFGTLQANLGSTYVNDFNQYGRTYQVTVQADSEFRDKIDDVGRLEVRGPNGEVPMRSLLTIDETLGPELIMRYNLYPAAQINGESALGVSSGEALDLMEQLGDQVLPAGMTYAWSGMSYQEKATSSDSAVVFALAALIVYLILSFQYESWHIPLAVVLTIPLAILGAVAGLTARQFDNNVYTQIGLVLLIALSAKNAILIVEFARTRHESGQDVRTAAISAARLRFRPILMTSLTFILGVFPLVVATGAGAAGRQAVGTAVCAGMLGGTLLGLLFTPMHFASIQGLASALSGSRRSPESQTASTQDGQQANGPARDNGADASIGRADQVDPAIAETIADDDDR